MEIKLTKNRINALYQKCGEGTKNPGCGGIFPLKDYINVWYKAHGEKVYRHCPKCVERIYGSYDRNMEWNLRDLYERHPQFFDNIDYED